MKKAYLGIMILLFLNSASSEYQSSIEQKDLILGQAPPGMTSEIFAPGLISTAAPEGTLSISNDGNFIVFRRHFNEKTEVYISVYENGSWEEPQPAPFFIKQYRFGDFTFAPD